MGDAEARREAGLCVALGLKLCLEALRLGAEIDELWLTSSALERSGEECSELMRVSRESVMMSESVSDKLSEQRAPQGVLALVRLPECAGEYELVTAARAVALCSVQDPANVGAALRTAAAFGYRALLTSDCADPFSPKSLRASMGAAFAVPITMFASGEKMTAALCGAGLTTLAATLAPGAQTLGQFTKPDRLAIVIGSEGRGLPASVAGMCDKALTIPILDRVESLNAAAAAAILMWELR